MKSRILVIEYEGVVLTSLLSGAGGGIYMSGPDSFVPPLDADELAELRWYLEKYLAAPFAVYEERGNEVRARLQEWGEMLLASLFGEGRAAAHTYYFAKPLAGEGIELELSSASPEFLGLPWELMRDPLAETPFALQSNGVIRSLRRPPSEPGEAIMPEDPRPETRLRVLMVIARPDEAGDVPYQIVARPLLKSLEPASGHVSFEVLRPPTFKALRQKIEQASAAGEPYHILHFDGHGALLTNGPGREAGQTGRDAPRGFLQFEKEYGGIGGQGDLVSAEDFAAAVKAGGIPLVILNACQSGALHEGGDLGASVATKLLQEGAAAVVAMSYSIYATAAANFMSEFYKALFKGRRIAEAVRMGRLKLYHSNLRPSPKGETPLEDWIIPVYYSQREISYPALQALGDSGEAPSCPPADPPAPDRATEEGIFVGRDDEFAKLERVLRTDGVVVIHGLKGVGKTELVKSFGRWLVSTRGIDDERHIIFHPFGAGGSVMPDEFLHTVSGRLVLGGAHETAHAAVLNYMQEHRLLFILDGFDALTRQTGTAPGGEVAAQWRDFLNEVNGTKFGSAFVTSRTPEAWLGDGFPRLSLHGLHGWDVNELLADHYADSAQAQARGTDQSLGVLRDYAMGHPQTLAAAARLSATVAPSSLLDALRGDSTPTGGVENVLDELLPFDDFSEEVVPPVTLALALFERVVSPSSLAQFSSVEVIPERLRPPDPSDWQRVFAYCVGRGWLSPVKSGFDLYYIHPALPARLVRLWRELAGDRFDDEYEAAWAVNIGLNAALAEWLRQDLKSEGHGDALLALRNLEPLFVRAAGKSLERGMYAESLSLLSALDLFWEREGHFGEINLWVEKYLAGVGGHGTTTPDLNTPAGELWLFLTGTRVHDALRAGRLDEAEAISRQILREVEKSPETTLTGTAYHSLGLVEEMRGNYGQAELWFRKELDTAVHDGDRRNAAIALHHLGNVRFGLRDLEGAQAYFEEALKAKEELKDPRLLATTYIGLATLAKERADWESAFGWAVKARAVGEDAEMPHVLGVACHVEAEVARRRGDAAGAEELYRKALQIFAAVGDAPNLREVAASLAALAYENDDVESAEEWYRFYLSVEAGEPNRRGAANVLSRLGDILMMKGDLSEAAKYFRQALKLWDSLDNPSEVARACNAIATAALHEGDVETSERYYRRCLDLEMRQGNQEGIAIARFNLGNTARQRGELDKAEESYLAALRIYEQLGSASGAAAVCESFGYLEHMRKRPAEAVRWLVRRLAATKSSPAHVVSLGGGTPNPLGLLAHLTRAAGVEALERSWEEVTGERLPDDIRSGVFLAWGEQEYESGRPLEALEWAARCASLRLGTESPVGTLEEPLWFIAHLTYELGLEELKSAWLRAAGSPLPEKIEEAVTRFIREKKGEPEAWAWYHRGNAMFEMKGLDEALACYDNALAAKADFTPAQEAKGVLLEQMGRHEEALALLTEVLEARPESLRALEWHGIALGELGRYEESLVSFDAILKIDPDNAGAFYNKACCYSLAGRTEQALQHLRRAVELEPDTYREMAKNDPTLEHLRQSEQFKSLIYSAGA